MLSTPFSPDGAIDSGALEREIDWVYRQGVHGVVVGMVSEVLKLDGRERRLLTEKMIDFNAKRGMTVVSVGAESTRVMVDLARHATETGADAVMAIPPTITPMTDEEAFRHYSSVIGAVDVPVIVQDASGYVGRPLSLPMQARLMAEHGPNRVFFKPEAPPLGPRLTALREATEGQAVIFEGSGGIALIESYRRGASGTMPGPEACWAVAALWQALEEHDDERAYRIGGPLALLISMQTSLDSFIAVEKHLLVKQGVFERDRMREPIGFELDDQGRLEVERLLQRLQKEARIVG